MDKGNNVKEGHGGLPREKVLGVCGKEGKRRKKCEEECLVLMCGEVFMEKECARIKCRNPTLAKCGGEAQHLEKLEVGSLPGLPNVQSSTTRGKTPRIGVFLVSLKRS